MILHPLINPESNHYNQDGRQSIQDIEEKLSVDEMIGACTFNIMKYTLRLDTRGQKEADLVKIKTYQDYKDLLLNMRNKYNCGSIFVNHAYKLCGVELSYT